MRWDWGVTNKPTINKPRAVIKEANKKSMTRGLNPGKRPMIQIARAYLEDILRLAQLLGYP